MFAINWSNNGATSCGPGLASGWPWKLNAEVSVRAIPCSDWSNNDWCVILRLMGKVFSSIAKPWFWLVIMTTPDSMSWTGWFAPWWPNFIFIVLAPDARPRSWWPKQIPKIGIFVSKMSWIADPHRLLILSSMTDNMHFIFYDSHVIPLLYF